MYMHAYRKTGTLSQQIRNYIKETVVRAKRSYHKDLYCYFMLLKINYGYKLLDTLLINLIVTVLQCIFLLYPIEIDIKHTNQ